MKKYLSSLLMLIAAAIWGFAFSAQKAAADVPAFTLVFARSIFGTVFLFFLIMVLDKVTKNGRRLVSKKGLDFTKVEIIGGVACGGVLSLASVLQQAGIVDGTDAGKAAFITALYVVLVPVFGLVLKRRSPINAWISVGIAVVGFYLLCIKGDFSIESSDALVLLCAIVFTMHILVIDHFSPKCDGVRMSCIQFSTAFVISTVLSLIFEGVPDFSALFSVLPALLYFGVCSGGIAYTLQIIGQRDSDPAVASIILSLESVFGAIGGAIFLNEKMEVKEYIGCAVVFVAIVIAQLDFKEIFKKRTSKQ